MESKATMPLLHALQACTRVTASLYGSVRLRKQIIDPLGETIFTSDAHTLVMAMQSENAAPEILKQALVAQKMQFGSGGSTLVNLCRVLLDACCDLRRQGVPTQRICSVLRSVGSLSQQTCTRMRLPLNDLPRYPMRGQRPDVLQWLGDHLNTPANETVCLQSVSPMNAAVQIAKELGSTFENISNPSFSVVFQESIGTSSSSVRVFSGLLLPLQREDGGAASVSRLFAGNPSGSLSFQGIALVNGDVALPSDPEDFKTFHEALVGVQLLFVHGEIADNAIDLLWHQAPRVICVPVATQNDLTRVVQLCEGALVVTSIFEMQPFAVSHSHVSLDLLPIATRKPLSRKDDDACGGLLLLRRQSQSPESSNPLVSVLISAPAYTIAKELENETLRALHRLHNTLRCGYALPGNGAVLCGCSAAIRFNSTESVKDHEASEVADRIADAFLRLGTTLLENAGIEADYLSSYVRVRQVHAHYLMGLEQLGPKKFFAICPYNATEDFALLPIESYRRMDDYEAVLHAMQRAFRVLELALSIEQYSIGGLA